MIVLSEKKRGARHKLHIYDIVLTIITGGYEIMRLIYTTLLLGALASVTSACSQTAAVQPKVAIQKPIPTTQVIHLHKFLRDEVSSFGLGMLDSACISLDTIRSDATMTVMKCQPSPEQKVLSEIGRVLLKYSIKADYRLKDGIIEVK